MGVFRCGCGGEGGICGWDGGRDSAVRGAVGVDYGFSGGDSGARGRTAVFELGGVEFVGDEPVWVGEFDGDGSQLLCERPGAGVEEHDLHGDLAHEQVRSRVLEDVAIGRLLAREKRRVEVMNLSAVLGVRMYATWRETVDGMSKNSYEIAGKGTFGLVLLFVALALGWVLAGSLWWAGLGLLTLSGVFVALTARAALWPTLLMPMGLLIGAGTLVRSWWWRRTGRTQWKGRVYPPS